MKTRKHIRLRNFDYSSLAWYFITICTKDREHAFGEIKDGQMHLSAIGEQAYLYWNEIPKHFPHIELGEFIIMPDHIHGIIGIIQSPNNNAVRTRHVVSQQGEIQNRESHPVAQLEKTQNRESHPVAQLEEIQNRESYPLAQQTNQFGKTIAGSLSAIIGQYKSTLTRWSRKNGYENFAWQGRFHDHIIRNDGAFRRISYYIKNNPTNWNKKKFTQ